MAVVFKNNAKTTLASSLTSSATSVTVADGSTFPSLSGGNTFFCTFDNGTNVEVVKVTARSSNTLTIVRAQDDTTARAFSTGAVAELRLTAGILNLFSQTGVAITDEIEAYLDANGTTFPDNVKAQFGAGNDLQIYHDGSHSYIKDQGTGQLVIDGNAVILQYSSAAKLATTSTGIDVTGTVTATGGNSTNWNTAYTYSQVGHLPLAGGTLTGNLNAGGGINGLTLSNGISGTNFNISGVNQLTINDPGEGIAFGGGSTAMNLAIVDDATDRILRYSGTGAVFDVVGTITADALVINKAAESLANQPSIISTFDSSGTDGLALISIEHLTNSGASALGAGLRFQVGDGATGTADKQSYIFQRGGGQLPLVYIADKSHEFYVDHHDNNIDGTSYSDYGTLALTLTEAGNVVATGTVTATGGNSTNWNTAYGWGNHASGGYRAASESLYYKPTREASGSYINLNTATTPGIYRLHSAGNHTGHPTGDGYSFAIILDNSDVHGQLVFDRVDDGRLYIRAKATSSFATSDWNRVWSDADFANNSANWNTAFGWGNHASAGYSTLTSNETVSGFKTFTHASGIKYYGTAASPLWLSRSSSTNVNIRLTSSSGTTYVGQGASSGTLKVGTTADLIGAGNTVWHEGTLTTTNKSNYDTAFGWGNHASAGYLTSYTDTNTHTHLDRTDNRTISPSEFAAGDLHFGFTSYANNNSSPYADFIHMRSYGDSSGGSDNLVMFKKSGIGMRIWQQTFGSSTAYSNYEDVWHTGTLTTTNKANYDTAFGWGNHASASYATQSYVGTQISNLVDSSPAALNTLNELAAALGDDANFSTTVNANIAAKLPLAGGALTGAVTTNSTFDGRNVSVDGTKLDTIATSANNYSFPYTIDTAATANTVVRRQANGYIYAVYYNGSGTFSTSGNASGMGMFTGTNGSDTFGRSYTAAAARTLLNVENGATADQTQAEINALGITAANSQLLDSLDSTKFTYYRGIVSGDWDTIFTTASNQLQTSGLYQVQNLASGHSNHPTGVYTYGGVFAWNLANHTFKLYSSHTGDLSFQSGWSNDEYSGWRRILTTSYYGSAWTSANDGAGSGLDADLLDGQHGTYYANEDARKSVPSSGNYQITNSTSPQTLGTGYLRHDFLNSSGPPGSSYRSVLSISSYTGGSQWTQLSFNYNQGINTPIYFRQNQYNGTSWGSWHQLWDSANDGSGSGLDADLLDGIDSGSFLRSDTSDSVTAGVTYTWGDSDTTSLIVGRSSGNAEQIYIGGWSSANSNDIHRIRGSSNLHIDSAANGNLYLNYYRGGTTYIGGANVAWHAGNDGSGSGLDADLLDGLQLHTGRNNEVNKVVRTDSNGYIQAGWINTTSGARTTQAITRVYASDDDYLRYYTLANFGSQIASHVNYNSLQNKPTIPTNNNQLTNGSSYVTTSQLNLNDRIYISDTRSASRAPSYYDDRYVQADFTQSTNLGVSGGDTWATALTVSKWSTFDTSHRQEQLIFAGTKLARRVATSDSAWSAAHTIWDSSTDGSGSTLDADLLDGLQGTSYARKGNVGYQGANDLFTFPSHADGNSTAGDQSSVQIYQPTAQDDAFIAFHVSGDYAGYFGLDGTTNDLFWGGWSVGNNKHKIFHAGNSAQFTSALNTKLAGIATSANNYSFPYTVSDAASNSTVVRRTGSGYIIGNYINMTANDVSSGLTKIACETGNDNYMRWSDAAGVRSFINVENGATADQSAAEILAAIKTVDVNGTSGVNAGTFDGQASSYYWSQASTGLAGATRITSISNFNNTLPSGWYQSSTASNRPPGSTWYNMMNVRHSNTANDHGFQIAMSYYDNNFWSRSYQGGSGANNGTYQSWAKSWTTANDGSGSTLDADTVDGIEGASIVRTDATTTIANNITTIQRGQFTTGQSGQNNSNQSAANALSYHYGYQFGGYLE